MRQNRKSIQHWISRPLSIVVAFTFCVLDSDSAIAFVQNEGWHSGRAFQPNDPNVPVEANRTNGENAFGRSEPQGERRPQTELTRAHYPVGQLRRVAYGSEVESSQTPNDIPSQVSIPLPQYGQLPPGREMVAPARNTVPTARRIEGTFDASAQKLASNNRWPESTLDTLEDSATSVVSDLNSANLDIPIPDPSEAENGISMGQKMLEDAVVYVKQLFTGKPNTDVNGQPIEGAMTPGVDMKRVFGSLAIVLGGYFSLVWILRRFGGLKAGGLPTEVVEVLGYSPFGPKKNLQVVRLGSKLLLLMNGPEGTHPIGEISDPDEVEYLAGLCSSKRNVNSSRALQNVIGRIDRTRLAPDGGRTSTNGSSLELEKIVRAIAGMAKNSNASNVFEA